MLHHVIRLGFALGFAGLSLAALGCDGLPPGLPGAERTSPFKASEVVVEVDFQQGAEPFTGQTVYGDTWDLTVENIREIVGPDVDLVVPSELGDMGDIDDDDVPAGDLDSAEILALAAATQDVVEDADTAAYHVLFVDRFFEKNGERQENVLGVSIGDSRAVAMFKPVIGDGGGLLEDGVDRFVEQTTMIHELGHALGLVNNGIEMQRDHQDEANGAHCDDDQCVMFFLNEGFSDALQFARDALLRGDRVLFDDDCLADAEAARADAADD